MKNKYVKRSKISEAKFRSIIMHFCLELDPVKIAALTRLHHNTINRYLRRIRIRIAELCESQAYLRQAVEKNMSEHHECCSPDGYKQPLEKRLPIFSIRSRNDHIYTSLLPNGIQQKQRRFLQSNRALLSCGIPKQWQHYDAIVDLNGQHYYRLGFLSSGDQDNNAAPDLIDQFIGFTRKRLKAFNLKADDHLRLVLKECEFRFNNRHEDLYPLLLRVFRDYPLA